MIRALFSTLRAAPGRAVFAVLPLTAGALLAGCVTPGYQYREDRGGGYYYGSPSVEYRDVTPYPYGPYGAYPYGYYGPYAYPYGYGYRHYGYRHHGGYPYGYPYRYVPRYRTVPYTDRTPDRPRSPWRDLDRLPNPPPRPVAPLPPRPTSQPVPPPGGSGMGERLRRARERAAGQAGEP